MASHGQIFSQSQHPMHLGWSMMQVAFNPGWSGPGSLSMQSTGQTAIQTSHPVQLSGLMRAFGRPFRGCAVVVAIAHHPAYGAADARFRRSPTSRLTTFPSAAPAALPITCFMICPWFAPTNVIASSISCFKASSESCCGR